MQRILEPEIMDDAEQALAYAKADFAASNQWFVDQFSRDFPAPLERLLDIGCGPGDVDVRLARARPTTRITAVDGAINMIRLAQQTVEAAGLGGRIRLAHGRIPGLALPDAPFDAILSKDLLHHLADPQTLWSEVRRLGRAGTAVFVMDLFRPATPAQARAIVETVAPDADPILKTDFINSLCAAFTVAEVAAQLRAARLPFSVSAISERHLLVKGRLL
jgi:ubiquinone/menaquinone biosynthesis C-methylase UbiE